jgi:hypothetical protein
MQWRQIKEAWGADVLENWVARRWDEDQQSMDYWGFVEERRGLLMVAVSANDEMIFTVHFDTASTRRYHRHRRGETGFFDEVRDAPDS